MNTHIYIYIYNSQICLHDSDPVKKLAFTYKIRLCHVWNTKLNSSN